MSEAAERESGDPMGAMVDDEDPIELPNALKGDHDPFMSRGLLRQRIKHQRWLAVTPAYVRDRAKGRLVGQGLSGIRDDALAEKAVRDRIDAEAQPMVGVFEEWEERETDVVLNRLISDRIGLGAPGDTSFRPMWEEVGAGARAHPEMPSNADDLIRVVVLLELAEEIGGRRAD